MWRFSAATLLRQATLRPQRSFCGRIWQSFVGRVPIDTQTRQLSSPSEKTASDEDEVARPGSVASLTPEELHNIRQNLERASKAERVARKRLEHEQRTEAALAKAEAKKTANVRKNAAKAVPHLLGTDLALFQTVLAELNPSASSSFDPNRDRDSWTEYQDAAAGGENAFSHYRAIFLDSVPSFSKLLVDDPAAIDRLGRLKGQDSSAAEDSAEKFKVKDSLSRTEQLLDELAAAGFSDLEWAKSHRQRKNKTDALANHIRRIARKKQQLSELKENLGSLRRDVKILEQEIKKSAERADDNSKKETEESALKSFFKQLTSLFKSGSLGRELPAKDGKEKSRSQTKKLRRLEKKLSAVRHAEDQVMELEQQLERIIAEAEKSKPALTDAEYDDANKAARRILAELCPAVAAHMNSRHANMIEQYRILDAQTDLTSPHEWYPRARLDRRKIVFHGGPTNSGKTYTALQRLKEAERGLYLGPLRLLAAEVYETLTSQGIYTNLLTGQERRDIPFSTHSAATVEMAPTDEEFDVVVIDEIQMISERFRGFAWTRALLGIQCKEIHVCGGLEAHDLVKKIAEVCGDEFEVHKYSRFSELTVAEKSVSDKSQKKGSYRRVQPGDCIVAFSRNDIFAIKREIEKSTDHKCCVICKFSRMPSDLCPALKANMSGGLASLLICVNAYSRLNLFLLSCSIDGSLPPATRTDQARRFNDPSSGYDVLVASDAIGMGLNLNIRRIIFNSMFKNNGENIVRLDHSSVKQIAGRAGRRNSPFPNGEVTCRDPADMDYLRKCMHTDIAPIRKAGLIPTAQHFEMFAAVAEKYDVGVDVRNKLHRIIRQFSEMARLKGDFFMCRRKHLQLVARLVDAFPLSISDKYIFCMSPVNEKCNRSMGILHKFASKHAASEVSGLSHRLVPKPPKSFEDMSRLCGVHHELELFLWLSNKFPGNAMEQKAAEALKEKAIELINGGLMEAEKLKLDHDYIKRDKKLRASWAESKTRGADVDDLRDFVHSLDEDDDFLDHFEVDDV